MSRLNYHHLRYFREVATEGHLGRAADRLNVAQSALSIQIRQLEESLGVDLFERVSRKLVLTEAGRIALDHADQIFNAGDELLATLQQNSSARTPLRIGAMSTLSRNFQLQFLGPLLADADSGFWLKSGSLETLLHDLDTLTLDVVLTTQVPPPRSDSAFAAQRIAEQPVRIHGKPDFFGSETLGELLRNAPVILPTESVIRAGFESLVARLGVQPRIVASVDDMAMVRLLAREGVGLAVAPSVVVADEIKAGILETAAFDLGISEPFFAVTIPRRFPHPALADLLQQQSS
ncbi:LysR family transcriptional regulator [Hoeflea prorocentri]|uniref:LysR family transcriptional regulator n=1 Tax=Hoeflea prorocentri TaxID=1922333 RepID=A0A9X3ZJ41_9HYPH|nr:LysR family transcriptional regulator [Hoeflea prorocentri]MCY6382531.1 LysR family transcriptional regulator [Hoeflea prorocentri]MDA5400331.1 LysR family transcriptional regulator [Hoeflea prorocentri]